MRPNNNNIIATNKPKIKKIVDNAKQLTLKESLNKNNQDFNFEFI